MYYVWKLSARWRRNGDFAEPYSLSWSWTQRYRKKAEAIAKCDSLDQRSVVMRGQTAAKIHDNGKEPSGRPADLAGLPIFDLGH